MLTPGIPDVTEAPDVIRLGIASKRLMEDRAFIAACQATEEELMFEWYESEDVVGREKSHAAVTALALLIKKIGIHADRGEQAQAENE